MKVFVTGATGYIGGSLVRALVARGDSVSGLARDPVGQAAVEAMGARPVAGSLADWSLLIAEAKAHDAVIEAASADDPYGVSAFLTALEGSGKTLIRTSGTSIVGDMAAGRHDAPTVTEESFVGPRFEKAGRHAIDRAVMAAAADKVRGIVVCPSMIYGEGSGPKPESVQVPELILLAKQSGVARHLGPGENIWSHVQIDDLVALYLLALDGAEPGDFFFAAQGEARLRDIAVAIGRMLRLGDRTEPLDLNEAVQRWGPSGAHYTFGSNSRVSAARARERLGWSPSRPGLIEEIESGYYARRHASGPATG
ncbi:Nucleoside-diphosphate-sugar epimerase [Tistlia consotensis]|uniref:Nucleoside-diphosphate-sugar epimerase n=1 Tax=Tistlia consotensis USBA 355 TaxID=560819 RepID=A0A1Y6BCJ9_9PROT|nr:NAD-dependent epimerase/dehydratase family protein [Tistlia consotensis]SMF02403.1 Nucleoside-diphosphate-sugar epimerase [Tistlia consotensis USBA 355]SNS26895.1 Nucleoside-diphosphate-sugar epimerase [Tistlia consotensis]